MGRRGARTGRKIGVRRFNVAYTAGDRSHSMCWKAAPELELESFATPSFIRGFTANAAALVLEYQLEAKPGRTGDTQSVEQVTSLDIATGALAWRQSATFSAGGASICKPEFDNGNIRSVNVALVEGVFKPIVRMRQADGALIWQRELPFTLVNGASIQCASVTLAGSALIALTNGGQVHFTRIASGSGDLQWLEARNSEFSGETQLLANGELAVYFDGQPIKARTISMLDGHDLCMNPLTSANQNAGSAQAQVRIDGNSLVVVASGVLDTVRRAFLQEVKYALDTGSETAQRRLFGVRRDSRSFSLAYDYTQPANPAPVVLNPDLGSVGRSLTLRRLNPQTGAVIASVVIETPLATIPEFTNARILTADVASAWILGTSAVDLNGLTTSTIFRVNFNGEIFWSDTVSGAFQNISLANPQHIVVSGSSCVATTPCAPAQLVTRSRVLNAQTGHVILQRGFQISVAGSAGNDLAWADTQIPRHLTAFDAFGQERWSQTFIASSGANAPTPVALTPLANDYAFAQYENFNFSAFRRTRVGRYAQNSGALLWERLFQSVSNSSIVMQPDAGGLLFSTRHRDNDTAELLGGDMVYLDAQTGATRHSWTVNETHGHSIRPFGLIQGNVSAVRQFRSLGSDLDTRHLYYTRQNVDLTSGLLTPEHVFQASISDALRGADSWGATATLSDGSMLAISTLNQPSGALRTRLERWPAPLDVFAGDVRITSDAVDGLVTGLGSTVSIAVQIENASARPVTAQLGFLDATSDTVATVRACQANLGSQCPQLGLATSQPITIAANDVLTVRYEISDPKFAQVRNSANVAGGTFFVLPEYAFGDRLLANNLAFVTVRGAGNGDGFE